MFIEPYKKKFNLDTLYNNYTILNNNFDYELIVIFIDNFIKHCFNKYNLHNYYNGCGRPAYSHEILAKSIILCYCDNIYSGREIEKQIKVNKYFQRLTHKQTPCYHVINDFKRNNNEIIEQIFAELIQTLIYNKIIDLKMITIDGTKIRANASKTNTLYMHEIILLKKILNHKIIKQITTRYEKYTKNNNKNRIKILNRRITKFLEHKWNKKYKNPKEKKNNKKLRKATINYLKISIKSNKILEKRKTYLLKIQKILLKTEQTSISITDPESKWMPNKNEGIDLNYNIQAINETKNNFIININATQDINDVETLPTQIQKIQQITQQTIENTTILADNGYYNEININYLEKQKANIIIPNRNQAQKQNNKKQTPKSNKKYSKQNFKRDYINNTFICPENKILPYQTSYFINGTTRRVYYTTKCKNCPYQLECAGKYHYKTITEYTTQIKEKIELEFEKEENKKLYKKRNTIEIVFAIIKHDKKFRQTKTYGLKNMNTECKILAISINIKKLIKILQNK